MIEVFKHLHPIGGDGKTGYEVIHNGRSIVTIFAGYETFQGKELILYPDNKSPYYIAKFQKTHFTVVP